MPKRKKAKAARKPPHKHVDLAPPMLSTGDVKVLYYYRPAVSEDGVGESMVGELVERIFGGSPSELVSHLLESDQVDSGELDRIKQLVRQHERQRKSKNGAGK